MHQRPSIFSSSRLTRNRRKFEEFYSSPLPAFIEKLDTCDCLSSLSVCPLANQFLCQSQLSAAESEYEKIKSSCVQKVTGQYVDEIKEIDLVLQPQLRSLLRVIKVQRVQPIRQILKHCKCQYITFWIYGLLCSRWPALGEFQKQVQQMAVSNGMDIDFNSSKIQDKLRELHSSKLSVAAAGDNYMQVVRNIIQGELFSAKMAALCLVGGRERESFEIIKACYDLD